MTEAFAAAIVSARLVVVAGWIAVAVLMAVSVPTLSEAQSGALGQLIPADSRAIEAEELSAERFAFPLASRTVVVERDPEGLSAGRVAATARAIRDVNRNVIPHVHAEGAYGITNAIPGLSFARERDTANLSYLLYVAGVQPGAAGAGRRGLHTRAGRSAVGVRGHHRRDPGPRRAGRPDRGAAAADRARHRRDHRPDGRALPTLAAGAADHPADRRGRLPGLGAARRAGRSAARHLRPAGGGADHGGAAVRRRHRLRPVLHVALQPPAASGRRTAARGPARPRRS